MLQSTIPITIMKKFLFQFGLFCLFFTNFVSTSFIPADHYLISCGSHDSAVTDVFHREFIGDESNFGSNFLSSSKGTKTLITDSSESSSPLYRTARTFNRPSKYVFQIKDQGVHHLVRLHFNFINSTLLSSSLAQFHVLANGFLLLRDFNVSKLQEGLLIKEFIMKIDDEQLEITFVPSERSNLAYVNAIEVISAPKDLINDLGFYVDSEKNLEFSGLKKYGFETEYRVNVGGLKVTPFNDSLWRTWIQDDKFLKSEKGLSSIRFSGRINYQTGGASREVGPDNVYNTARVIKSLDDSIPNSNMTWIFPRIEEYTYLVRLHFCDIASIANYMLYFNLYLNGNLAYENMDLSTQTNGYLASPFYTDFVVDGRLLSGFLTVSIGASNMSLPHATDAILNGIEVFKMNNRMGSFDGEVCAGTVLKESRSGNTGVFLMVLAAVLLLLAASVVLQRRRTNEALGFTRLPIDVSDVIGKYENQLSTSKV